LCNRWLQAIRIAKAYIKLVQVTHYVEIHPEFTTYRSVSLILQIIVDHFVAKSVIEESVGAESLNIK